MNENLKDMIQGEFNRICVTDHVEEIDNMLICLMQNLVDMCRERRKEIRVKQINAKYGTGVNSSDVIYTDTDSVKIKRVNPEMVKGTIEYKMLQRLDNLHIETRPISPEQNTKFLYYNMAVDDCIKVVRAYLESVKK